MRRTSFEPSSLFSANQSRRPDSPERGPLAPPHLEYDNLISTPDSRNYTNIAPNLDRLPNLTSEKLGICEDHFSCQARACIQLELKQWQDRESSRMEILRSALLLGSPSSERSNRLHHSTMVRDLEFAPEGAFPSVEMLLLVLNSTYPI